MKVLCYTQTLPWDRLPSTSEKDVRGWFPCTHVGFCKICHCRNASHVRVWQQREGFSFWPCVQSTREFIFLITAPSKCPPEAQGRRCTMSYRHVSLSHSLRALTAHFTSRWTGSRQWEEADFPYHLLLWWIPFSRERHHLWVKRPVKAWKYISMLSLH